MKKRMILLIELVILACLLGCGGNFFLSCGTGRASSLNKSLYESHPTLGLICVPDDIMECSSASLIRRTGEKVLVEKRSVIYELPNEKALSINMIYEGTVITVLSSLTVNNEIWLCVEIPVLDTPVNTKGWIKKADTTEFTKDRVQDAMCPIYVRQGESIYETSEFNGLSSIKPILATGSEWGKIEKRVEGFIELSCPGGKTIFVKESAIIYPGVK